MLPQKNRLSSSDFKQRRSSRSFHSPHFQLRIGALAPDAPSQASAVVSLKVAATAVARNLVRRRVYAVLDASVRGKMGFFITITAKSGAAALPFAALEHELTTLRNGALSG